MKTDIGGSFSLNWFGNRRMEIGKVISDCICNHLAHFIIIEISTALFQADSIDEPKFWPL